MPTQLITPVIPAQTTVADDIFTAAFGRCHHFRVQLEFDEAKAFIQRIDAWNEFDAAHVIDALENIDRLIPRSPNGERSYSLSIGREFSPVIYLERPEFQSSSPLSESCIANICREMELIGLADEAICDITPFSCSRGRMVSFRFWWD